MFLSKLISVISISNLAFRVFVHWTRHTKLFIRIGFIFYWMRNVVCCSYWFIFESHVEKLELWFDYRLKVFLSTIFHIILNFYAEIVTFCVNFHYGDFSGIISEEFSEINGKQWQFKILIFSICFSSFFFHPLAWMTSKYHVQP